MMTISHIWGKTAVIPRQMVHIAVKQFFINLLDKWLHWTCICVHSVQWVIFTAGKDGKLEDGVRMRGVFFSSQDLKTPMCTHSAGLL